MRPLLEYRHRVARSASHPIGRNDAAGIAMEPARAAVCIRAAAAAERRR